MSDSLLRTPKKVSGCYQNQEVGGEIVLVILSDCSWPFTHPYH